MDPRDPRRDTKDHEGHSGRRKNKFWYSLRGFDGVVPSGHVACDASIGDFEAGLVDFLHVRTRNPAAVRVVRRYLRTYGASQNSFYLRRWGSGRLHQWPSGGISRRAGRSRCCRRCRRGSGEFGLIALATLGAPPLFDAVDGPGCRRSRRRRPCRYWPADRGRGWRGPRLRSESVIVRGRGPTWRRHS